MCEFFTKDDSVDNSVVYYLRAERFMQKIFYARYPAIMLCFIAYAINEMYFDWSKFLVTIPFGVLIFLCGAVVIPLYISMYKYRKDAFYNKQYFTIPI